MRDLLRRVLMAVAVLLSFAGPLSIVGPAHGADDDRMVRIGVLSFRPLDITERNWRGTAEYLQRTIPGTRFQIVPAYLSDLGHLVAEGRVDFVITNPEHFVLLKPRHGLAAIATLIRLVEGHPVDRFGGVMFTRADNTTVHTMADLPGRRISAVSKESFGGYMVELWTMLKAGMDTETVTAAMHFTGQPHDLAVREVLEGRADAGLVRTGVLESMAREGKLRLDEIRILNRQPPETFPQRLSTDTYPEWPVAALTGVSDTLVKAVSLALLRMPPDDPAARSGGYFGFSPPADYAPVEAVMLRLGAHPDSQFGLADIYHKYELALQAIAALGAVAVTLAALWLYRGNRNLGRALASRAALQAELTQANAELELRVAARTDELARSNAELEHFAYVASHDLREPLRMVSAFLGLLERRYGPQLDQDGREFIGFAVDGAQRMDRLILDLLDYSRVGRGAAPFEPVDAGEVLDSALANLAAAIAETDARIVLPQQTPLLFGDRGELVRLFQNLVGNAIKYHAPGRRPEIRLDASPDGSTWRFRIADNGIGIPAEARERVFQIFQRLHTHAEVEGTGIGLALCRKIVEHHGGTIAVLPGVTEGTILALTLPAAPA